jgi:dihydrodipicolinate synthase/N-acetylneuraminate lyase
VDYLEGTIRRVSYAVDAGISAVQLALPPWLPLRDDEVVRSFATVASAVPEPRFIHYNTRFSKTFVEGHLYQRIAAEVPAVVGTKFVGTIDELSAALDLAHPGSFHPRRGPRRRPLPRRERRVNVARPDQPSSQPSDT